MAEKAGVLETKVSAGQEVKIGELVAVIDDSKSAPAKSGPDEKKATPASTEAKPAPKSQERPTTALSPAVRRMVDEEKVDPAGVTGTGKGGRLTKGDVMAAAENRSGPRTSDGEKAPAASDEKDRQPQDGRFTRKKMSPLRRKIAAQLVMAQHTAAILTTFNECDMSAVQELRAKSQEAFTKKNGLKLGFMSFFIKAAVEGLKAVPTLNGRIEDEDFIENHFYDIGVAVGTERGLIVPVVRCRQEKFRRSRTRHRRLRDESARRKIEDRRFAGRHVHDFKRRRLRLAAEHADFESAAERDSRHAQNHGAAGRG